MVHRQAIVSALLGEEGRGTSRLARNAVLVLLGSGLIAICAKIGAPTWPVPISMQPFAVLLLGVVLGSRLGALAALTYLLEGAAGLPVFAAAPFGGIAYFAGPTGGYLLAFPVAAFIVGLLAERSWDRSFIGACAAMAVGQAVILAGGFAWMAVLVGPKAAFGTGILPFIVGDVLKILLAAAALPAAWRLIGRENSRAIRGEHAE